MLSSHSSSVAVWPHAADGVGVELPHRVEHRMIVRIENVFLEFGVAGDVHLRDAVGAARR